MVMVAALQWSHFSTQFLDTRSATAAVGKSQKMASHGVTIVLEATINNGSVGRVMVKSGTRGWTCQSRQTREPFQGGRFLDIEGVRIGIDSPRDDVHSVQAGFLGPPIPSDGLVPWSPAVGFFRCQLYFLWPQIKNNNKLTSPFVGTVTKVPVTKCHPCVV